MPLSPRLRWLGYAAVGLPVGLLTVTSGPRSIEGYPTPSEDDSPTAEVSAADDTPEVFWDVLAGLNYETGEIAEELKKFVGDTVKIPGFMVPLEDFASEASEFLLVPYVGACVHTPPPPPNQLVYVKMEKEERVPVTFWDPIWIHGTLLVEETENIYGSVSFRVEGIKVEPYKW